MYNTITLKQAADLIAAVGDQQTVLVQGEMGIGKSAILKMLKSPTAYPQFKDAYFCYVDITTKDVGDFIVPKIRDIDGILYCNDGDWVESLTALVEDEVGELHLVDWHEIMLRWEQRQFTKKETTLNTVSA